jgi:hypothetical protein
MNWLERARREIGKSACPRAGNTAERNPTAVMAVPDPALCTYSGSPAEPRGDLETVLEDFEERAAIMEFDGGLSRGDAEREAALATIIRYRLH